MSPLVGFAKVGVPVPAGTPMGGFAARTSGSLGIHDETSVRAMVVDGTAVVAVDVCVLHEHSIADIRDRVRSHVDEIVVTATHTHSGPAIGHGRAGGHDDQVHAAVVDAVADAVSRAAAGAVPASAESTRCSGLGVAKNRRHPGRSVDPPLTALRFTDGSGTPLGVLLSYPCHPVVLDGTNLLISGDYVSPLRDAVEHSMPGATALFLCGTAGDINTGHSAEASFRPRGESTRTFAEADRIGNHLAKAVEGATWKRVDTPSGHLTTAPVTLPFALPEPDQVTAEAQRWDAALATADEHDRGLWQSWSQWAHRWRSDGPTEWSGRVSVLDLAEQKVVFLPGEPFLATAARIAQADPDRILVVGYADGVPGYLPPADEIPFGGYEVADAHRYYGQPGPFAVGSAELLEAAALGLLDDGSRSDTR